jgi:hypothetical protein
MNIFKITIKTIQRILFPVSLDTIFSEESKEKTALRVAARFARGNINSQEERVTTQRKFNAEMDKLTQRVASYKHQH